jgi:lipoprotein signal peptidase
MGIAINYNNNDNTACRTPFLRNVLAVFGLVLIDQMIKFLLFSRFGDVMPVTTSESYENGYVDAGILNPPVLVIVKDWVFIQPLLHKGHILQAHGIYFSKWVTLLLTVIGLPLCYRYARFVKVDKRLLDKGFILIAAMAFSYWIDQLFYGGSIDYISLVQFAVFDLKDMYGVLAVAVFAQAHIHNQSWQMIKKSLAFKGSLTEFKEYINYERAVIKNIPAFFKEKSDGGENI